MYRKFILLVLGFVPLAESFSQNPKGVTPVSTADANTSGKTYALIIGISKYQSFHSLEYADRDATVFYNFLRSKAGGSIDSANIFFRTNEKAKAGDIWSGMSWLERRADSTGETAFIFFSGHGDAANAAEAYLLAFDAPNEGDANMYNMGGTFQVYNLKNKIKQMVARGVRVILITDACRTNDLPGKETGAKWTFQSITEEKAGEIQMTSCSGNEYSLEDKKWGNGRGVFSYWLLNGLSGLADNDPEDGSITLYELEKYVKDHVRSDTRSLSSSKPQQTPIFCCSDKSDMVVAKVDMETKALVLKTISNKEEDVGFAFAGRKKGNLFPDTARQKVYDQFLAAIAKKALIEPEGFSAKDYLNRLLPMVTDEQTKTDLADQFAGELINEAQLRITKYSSPPTEDVQSVLNYQFFHDGDLLLEWAMKYVSQNNDLMKELRIRKYFLEARALAALKTTEANLLSLKKIDSSLSLRLTAYGWQTKGIVLTNDSTKYNEALNCFDKALELNNNWTFALNNKATVYWKMKKYDSTKYYAAKALASNPGYAAAWNNMGLASRGSNQPDSAKKYFKKAIQLNPTNSIAWNNLGTIYQDEKQMDSTIFCYRKAIVIDPRYELAYNNLALLYKNQKQYDSAMMYYNKALEINPKNSDSWNGLGNVYFSSGKIAQAKSSYQNALAVKPRNEYAWFNLGLVFSTLGQPDSVKICYLRSIGANPQFDPAWYYLGFIYENSKQPDSAILCYKVAVNANPAYELAWTQLGINYYRNRRYDSAKLCFQKTLFLNPKSEYAWFNLGTVYDSLMQLDSAKFYYWSSLAVNPRFGSAMSVLARIYDNAKQYDSSKIYYRKLVTIDMKSDFAWNNLGIVSMNLKQYDSAKNYFMQAINLNPRSEYNWNNLGAAYDKVQQYDSAIVYYQNALKINPNFKLASLNLAICYRGKADTLFAHKQFEEAIIYFSKAVEIAPGAYRLIYTTASCYAGLHNKQEALRFLEEALKMGYKDFSRIETDKNLDWLRPEKEFQDLLEKYKK